MKKTFKKNKKKKDKFKKKSQKKDNIKYIDNIKHIYIKNKAGFGNKVFDLIFAIYLYYHNIKIYSSVSYSSELNSDPISSTTNSSLSSSSSSEPVSPTSSLDSLES